MTINGDASDPLYQIRMIIGDVTEPYYISEEVLDYICDENNGNVHASAKEAVRYLIGYFSRLFDQEVGDVRFKWGGLRDNYKKLLDDLVKNPSMGGTMVAPILGGTNLTEINRVRNSNVVQPHVEVGEFSSVSVRKRNTNPFLIG